MGLDGVAVGGEVGDVGIEVGEEVCWKVGDEGMCVIVGPLVGLLFGEGDGWDVGAALLGVTVGLGEGSGVGEGVGTNVGDDGINVGVLVGVVFGTWVGVLVGVEVGEDGV